MNFIMITELIKKNQYNYIYNLFDKKKTQNKSVKQFNDEFENVQNY